METDVTLLGNNSQHRLHAAKSLTGFKLLLNYYQQHATGCANGRNM